MGTNENQQGVVRCVGKPNENVKVYLEERSDLFLKENMTDRVGYFQQYYLLGREYRLGKQTVYLVRGILEGETGNSRQIHFGEEQMRSLDRRQKRQYPKYKVLGWALNQPGYGNDGAWRFAKDNEEFFDQASLLMLADGLDGSIAFYQWKDGDYQDLGGYYIYSDQDPTSFRESEPSPEHKVLPRQEDMGENTLPWNLPLAEEKKRTIWEDEPVSFKDKMVPYRENIKKKWKSQPETSPLRILTSISAVMLTVTLVMGMLLFNSVSTLDGIQSQLETMDMQIELIHSNLENGYTIQTSTDMTGSDDEVIME